MLLEISHIENSTENTKEIRVKWKKKEIEWGGEKEGKIVRKEEREEGKLDM